MSIGNRRSAWLAAIGVLLSTTGCGRPEEYAAPAALASSEAVAVLRAPDSSPSRVIYHAPADLGKRPADTTKGPVAGVPRPKS
jgi:poly(3-hydroxybutyrate) depolymerase